MIKDKYQRKYYSTKKGKDNRREASRRYYKTPKGFYNRYKKDAKKRNIPFEITLDFFMDFWKKSCYYCDSAIKTIGLDRINNKKGYLKSNIVSCCQICNKMKLNYSLPKWLYHIKKVIKNVDIVIIND